MTVYVVFRVTDSGNGLFCSIWTTRDRAEETAAALRKEFANSEYYLSPEEVFE